MLSNAPAIIVDEDALYVFLRDQFDASLTVDQLVDVVKRGVAARTSCTPFDAPAAPGSLAYYAQVRALRETLCPSGWKKDDTGNFSVVVSKSREDAIAVAAGDAGTGYRDGNPSTQYPRGPALHEAVLDNQISLPIFPPQAAERPRTTRRTWMLLSRVSERGEVRAELSLPRVITETGYVVNWKPRLILPMFTTSPTPEADRRRDAEDDAPISVDVRRKA